MKQIATFLLLGVFSIFSSGFQKKACWFVQTPLEMNQIIINGVVMGIRLKNESPVTVHNLPEQDSSWQFFTLDIHSGKDGHYFGCYKNDTLNDSKIIIDTNHDKNLKDERIFTFPKGPINWLEVPLSDVHKASVLERKKTVIQIIRTKKGRLYWRFGVFGIGKIKTNSGPKSFAVILLSLEKGLVAFDENDDGVFERILNRKELISIDNDPYSLDLAVEEGILYLNSTHANPVQVGFPAPKIHSKFYNEETFFNLQGQKGKTTLLMFSSPHCHGCKKAMPGILLLHKRLVETGKIDFVYVPKNKENVEYMKQRYGFSPMTLLDMEIWDSFRVVEMPMFIVIDGNGKIVLRESGGLMAENGKLESWLHEFTSQMDRTQ